MIDSDTRVCERSSSLIDHIHVNRPDNISVHGIISTGLTDHRLVYCVRKAIKLRLPARTITARSYINFDDTEYDDDLSSVPWSSVEAFDSADDAWGHFKTEFLKISKTISNNFWS